MNHFLILILIVVLLCLLTWYCQHIPPPTIEEFKTIHPHHTPTTPLENDKIFVSLASYRDPEVIPTVKNIIDTCSNPNRLRIVVYEQNHPDDPTTHSLPTKYTKHITLLQSPHTDAKGPTWARYVIQQQYSGEQYYLQLDSHTRLVPNWDTILIDMLYLLPQPSVLTQYPPEYDMDCDNLNTNLLRGGLYVEGFSPRDGFTRIQSEFYRGRRSIPFKSETWAACFSFSTSQLILDAPYDPHLPFLFFGEELDITIRLFTRGWYFYAPHKSVVFTKFKRGHRPTYWKDNVSSRRFALARLSRDRLFERLGMVGSIRYDVTLTVPGDLCTMGTNRSIEDYENFAGVDLGAQKLKGHSVDRVLGVGRIKQMKLNGFYLFKPVWWVEKMMYSLVY